MLPKRQSEAYEEAVSLRKELVSARDALLSVADLLDKMVVTLDRLEHAVERLPGRPPNKEKPLTAAEKQRRYRLRKKGICE